MSSAKTTKYIPNNKLIDLRKVKYQWVLAVNAGPNFLLEFQIVRLNWTKKHMSTKINICFEINALLVNNVMIYWIYSNKFVTSKSLMLFTFSLFFTIFRKFPLDDVMPQTIKNFFGLNLYIFINVTLVTVRWSYFTLELL